MSKHTRSGRSRTNSAPGNNGHGPALEHGEDSPAGAQSALEAEDAREEKEILEAMRVAGGAGAYLRIERKRPNESDYSLICPRIPLENYADATKLEDYLMSTFGGGDYKIQARKSGGSVVKQFPLRIDHSIPAKTPGEPKPEQKQNDTASIVRELVTQLVPLLKPATPVAPDNSLLAALIQSQTQMAIENAKSQTQMMTTIFAAQKSQGPDPTLTAILSKMERAIEKIGETSGSAKQKSGAAELLELLEVIDRVRDSSAQDEPTKGLLAQLGEGLAPIAKAMLAGGSPLSAASVLDPSANNGAGPPASPSPGVVDVDATAPAAATQTSPDQADAMNVFVQQALKQVARQALAAADRAAVMATQADKDAAAEEFALALTPQIPEAYDSQVQTTLNDPNWLVNFFGTDPRVKIHAAWLGKVREIILEDLKAE